MRACGESEQCPCWDAEPVALHDAVKLLAEQVGAFYVVQRLSGRRGPLLFQHVTQLEAASAIFVILKTRLAQKTGRMQCRLCCLAG